MAVTVVWASPDLDGLTAEAKNQIIKGIESTGSEVNEIHLNRKRIMSCLACGKGGYGKCLRNGTCSIRDDLQDIYDALRSSEAFVLVTPVYWHDMSENFKALLDRIRRMETSHNGYLSRKRAMIVACAGGYGLGTCQCLSHMEEVLNHMNISVCDRIPVERFNSAYMLPALYEAGKNFANKYQNFRFDDFHFA